MQMRLIGPGKAARLPDLVARFARSGRTIVVSGRSSFAACGAEDLVATLPPGTDVVHSTGDLPRIEDFHRIWSMWTDERPGCLVAIGGGRVIDTAKLLSIGPISPGILKRAILTNTLAPRRMPLIAVPTTAGSGSESTPFAVVYIEGSKHSLEHASVLPDAAVVDYRLLAGQPSSVIATAGLDAVCQSIESLLSRRASRRSAVLAGRGLFLGWNSLPGALEQKESALRRMALAANAAGRAIAVTRTTIPHALSYSISVRHGLAHGHAVALSMGLYLQRFGRDLAEDVRLERWRSSYALILRIIGCSNPVEVPHRWDLFLTRLGLVSSLSACGVSRKDVDLLAREFDPRRFNNSPLSLDPNEIPNLFT